MAEDEAIDGRMKKANGLADCRLLRPLRSLGNHTS